MSSTSLLSPIALPRAAARASTAARRPAAERLDADATLRRSVLAQLQHEPSWDARSSNVFVEGGKVIFQGLAQGAQARRSARRIALAVAGVREVWDARVPRREWQALA